MILAGINVVLSIYTLYCIKYELPKTYGMRNEKKRMMQSYTILMIILIIQPCITLVDILWIQDLEKHTIPLWIFNVTSWIFFPNSLPFFIFILMN